jgi:hypothetical protein
MGRVRVRVRVGDGDGGMGMVLDVAMEEAAVVVVVEFKGMGMGVGMEEVGEVVEEVLVVGEEWAGSWGAGRSEWLRRNGAGDLGL